MPVRRKNPSDELARLRNLWYPDAHSTGYQHASLVFAACKLLNPPPKSWEAKSLWLVFYNETDLPKSSEDVEPDVVRIFREGFSLYERYGKDESN